MKLRPTCPSCKYEFDDEEMWEGDYLDSGKVHVGEGDESELTCPNLDCKNKFKVTCEHIYDFVNVDD